MRKWAARHEFTMFLIIVVIVGLLAIGAVLRASNNVSSRTPHYECYRGGVLVIDEDYPLNGLGHIVDPEAHERVYFKGMDCVYK